MSDLRWLPVTSMVAVTVVAVATHAPARAAQYATAEEAAKRSFPEATSFKETTLQLSADEARAVAQVTGLAPRAAPIRALVAWAGPVGSGSSGSEKPMGFVVIDAVIGKFEMIDFAVGVAADGKIRNVEILTYRESHGYEVRLPAWRKQFVGKGKSDKLRVDEDINNISGATMSATHVTDGVRRIVATIDTLKLGGRL